MRVLVFVVLLALAPFAAQAAELRGRVVGITDGDTLTVLTAANSAVKVRLVGIDAPEHGQAWGQRSKEALSALAFGRTVRIETSGLDRWGRTLGRVWVDGVDVNTAMVERGAAWAWREQDPRLAVIEQQARAAHRGLWAMNAAQIEAPWTWRQAREDGRLHLPGGAPPQGTMLGGRADPGAVCGAKRYCREMTSCAEARHYLTQCGVTSLDGDGDGVPCSGLCKHDRR